MWLVTGLNWGTQGCSEWRLAARTFGRIPKPGANVYCQVTWKFTTLLSTVFANLREGKWWLCDFFVRIPPSIQTKKKMALKKVAAAAKVRAGACSSICSKRHPGGYSHHRQCQRSRDRQRRIWRPRSRNDQSLEGLLDRRQSPPLRLERSLEKRLERSPHSLFPAIVKMMIYQNVQSASPIWTMAIANWKPRRKSRRDSTGLKRMQNKQLRFWVPQQSHQAKRVQIG